MGRLRTTEIPVGSTNQPASRHSAAVSSIASPPIRQWVLPRRVLAVCHRCEVPVRARGAGVRRHNCRSAAENIEKIYPTSLSSSKDPACTINCRQTCGRFVGGHLALSFNYCHPFARHDRMRPMRRSTLPARVVGIPPQKLSAASLEMRSVRSCV